MQDGEGMARIANWTIMIYANGNNDLEPEMWQAKLAVEKIFAGDDVTVVMQIGREDAHLVNILRSQQAASVAGEQWTGVRRYLLTKGRAVLLADFGKKNMAEPCCLYEFVKEAIMDFPAERYMVILGGHGYQFVGSMPDYSQGIPYIMGFPEMARALDQACCEQGSQIDILIADVCYFNFIEVVYEFANHKKHAVRHVLTYICDGPIGGMPYDQIIKHTKSSDLTTTELIIAFIKSMELDLVAFKLEHDRLNAIKKAFHDLANCYSRYKADSKISVNEVLFVSDPNCPWWSEAQVVLQGLGALIIDYKRISNNDYGLINIANMPTFTPKSDLLYRKLKFTQGNAWTDLLGGGTSFPVGVDWSEDDFAPIPLAPEEVYAYISLMNAKLSMEQKLAIFEVVIAYKNWFAK